MTNPSTGQQAARLDLGPADGQQKMRLLARLYENLKPIPAWVDGDPLMEAIAAAVYEQCSTDPVSSLVVDDPRNIAAVAAHTARSRVAELEQQATTLHADSLSGSERQFLSYALDLASDQMASRGDEFDADDEAAMAKLRRLADGDDPACGDRYDDETCEMEPGHGGAHLAGNLAWDYGRAEPTAESPA